MSPRSGHVDTPLTNNNNSNGDNGVAIFGFCLAARSAYTVIVECVVPYLMCSARKESVIIMELELTAGRGPL